MAPRFFPLKTVPAEPPTCSSGDAKPNRQFFLGCTKIFIFFFFVAIAVKRPGNLIYKTLTRKKIFHCVPVSQILHFNVLHIVYRLAVLFLKDTYTLYLVPAIEMFVLIDDCVVTFQLAIL